ncbi:MAG TPA: serine/threonine-protein kinase, partial [Burkholderiaceae bacterium]|nr:serine/threonine-protein kinase [Burkholderiaceae bacterium]
MADSPASPPSSSGLHSGEPADDHDASCLPIGTRLGEFELTGLIGIGGFGIVYSARDHLLEREVAIKEYMPSALASRTADYRVTVKSERHQETFGVGLRSFVNEAKLLAQFDHPSLVKVFRFWEANGTAYMVMPYYRGTTLRSALKSLGEAPDETAVLQMLRPLLDALDVIHAGNCYHRDIAPDNILILESGRPVLLDFGAARRVIGDFTQALTVILKPGFAPVEQYANGPEMRQGPWTDIYALAAVLYYCIGGKTPTPSVSRMMRDTMVPARELGKGRYSESFLAAIDHALAVHIEERTASVTQLRTELGLEEIVEKSSRTRLGVGPAAAAVPAPAAAAAPVADAASPVTPV